MKDMGFPKASREDAGLRETDADREVRDGAYRVAAGELRSFIERVEHLAAEKKDIADQQKAVMAEAKGARLRREGPEAAHCAAQARAGRHRRGGGGAADVQRRHGDELMRWLLCAPVLACPTVAALSAAALAQGGNLVQLALVLAMTLAAYDAARTVCDTPARHPMAPPAAPARPLRPLPTRRRAGRGLAVRPGAGHPRAGDPGALHRARHPRPAARLPRPCLYPGGLLMDGSHLGAGKRWRMGLAQLHQEHAGQLRRQLRLPACGSGGGEGELWAVDPSGGRSMTVETATP